MKQLALDKSRTNLVQDKHNQSFVIKEAVKVLRQGGVIVYPTETAYGLGADFFNHRAINQVYKIKGRNYHKPLSVIVSDFKMAKRLVKFNQLALRLAKKHWPGPLTLVLEILNPKHQACPGFLASARQARVTNKSQITNFKFQTLALRTSSNKLATAIVRKFGGPITATSANISGKGECYSADQVINQFINKKNQPDLIIDAGRLPRRKVSMVVKVIDDKIEVLRKGKILP